MAKEKWLDPWREAFYAHNGPVRDAIKTKDPQRALEAIHEHLPAMIGIRDEVASLPVPNGFGPGLVKTLFNLMLGIKHSETLEIERNATLQAWEESIGSYQRELRRLESGRR